jgi:hypothetical protein
MPCSPTTGRRSPISSRACRIPALGRSDRATGTPRHPAGRCVVTGPAPEFGDEHRSAARRLQTPVCQSCPIMAASCRTIPRSTPRSTACARGPAFDAVTTAASPKLIDNALQRLPPEVAWTCRRTARRACATIAWRLSASSTSRFEEQRVGRDAGLDPERADAARLAGVPPSTQAMAARTRASAGLDGWLLTLDFPSYYAVMTYADDRELRRRGVHRLRHPRLRPGPAGRAARQQP